ncbi:MAG: penicillin-binding protein activator [Proteobacteria bacterium]|nr:penicillin-binding protein activator [Pseudomonadota bacterium]
MRKSFFAFLAVILLASCAVSTVREIPSTPRNQVARPAPPPKVSVPQVAPEALFSQGQKFYQNKEYNKSHEFFRTAAERWAGQPKSGEASLWALRSLVKGQRHHDVYDFSGEILARFTWADSNLSEILQVRLKAAELIGHVEGALSTAMTALTNPKLVKDAEIFRLSTMTLIQSSLSIKELEEVGSSSQWPGVVRSAAYFRLGEQHLQNNDQDSARKFFSRAQVSDQDNEWSLRAKEFSEQLEAVRRVAPRTVGAVLPLTGKNAAMGQKTLRGIQMGLGLYNNQPSSFKLAVVDSEGSPDVARRGVEKLVKEDNVIAVIGSLLSRNAPAVASKSNELGVPSIGLSQRAGLTEMGARVFRNAMTSEMQVRYLVKVAMEDLKMKKFAIVYPNDSYGVEFANLFWDEVLARGGQITAAQTYSPKETDFRDTIQKLTGTFFTDARSDEFKLRLKDLQAEKKTKSIRSETPEDVLPPIVNFDGVFIPDSARALGQISAALSYAGVRGPRLLGTNIWNNPSIAKRAGNFSDNLLFVDSFVPTDVQFQNSRFVKDYKGIFGDEPGLFEVQGYDAALVLRQLISQGATSRESLSQELADLKDFPGSIGPLSISQDREIQRPLRALTLMGSNIVPLEVQLSKQ